MIWWVWGQKGGFGYVASENKTHGWHKVIKTQGELLSELSMEMVIVWWFLSEYYLVSCLIAYLMNTKHLDIFWRHGRILCLIFS